MRLLRNIGLSLLVVAAFTSCTHDNKEDYDPDMVICFQPAIGEITKADNAVFPVNSEFSVWAFSLSSDKSWSTDSGSAQAWLSDERIKYNGTSWTTTDRKCWSSKNQNLTFFGYAPSTLSMSYDSSKGMCLKGFDVTKDDTDILFTDAVADVNKMACCGTAALPFRHALAKAEFKIESAATYTAKLHIKSIKLGGLSYVGDFQSVPSVWTPTSDKTEIELCKNEFDLSYDTKNLGSWTVLPQSGAREITITYDLYKEGEKALLDQHLTAKPIETVWGVGKQYVYTLVMSLDDITYKTDILERL